MGKCCIHSAQSLIRPFQTSGCYNAILALNGGEWEVESIDNLPDGSEPQITVEELTMCEVIVRNDPKVQALAKQVGKCPLTPLSSGRLTTLNECRYRAPSALCRWLGDWL